MNIYVCVIFDSRKGYEGVDGAATFGIWNLFVSSSRNFFEFIKELTRKQQLLEREKIILRFESLRATISIEKIVLASRSIVNRFRRISGTNDPAQRYLR